MGKSLCLKVFGTRFDRPMVQFDGSPVRFATLSPHGGGPPLRVGAARLRFDRYPVRVVANAVRVAEAAVRVAGPWVPIERAPLRGGRRRLRIGWANLRMDSAFRVRGVGIYCRVERMAHVPDGLEEVFFPDASAGFAGFRRVETGPARGLAASLLRRRCGPPWGGSASGARRARVRTRASRNRGRLWMEMGLCLNRSVLSPRSCGGSADVCRLPSCPSSPRMAKPPRTCRRWWRRRRRPRMILCANRSA